MTGHSTFGGCTQSSVTSAAASDTHDGRPGAVTGSPAQLPHVLHVTGNKLFDTTCGKRSLPLLVPVEGGSNVLSTGM